MSEYTKFVNKIIIAETMEEVPEKYWWAIERVWNHQQEKINLLKEELQRVKND